MDIDDIETVIGFLKTISEERDINGFIDRTIETGSENEIMILACCLERGLFMDKDVRRAYMVLRNMIPMDRNGGLLAYYDIFQKTSSLLWGRFLNTSLSRRWIRKEGGHMEGVVDITDRIDLVDFRSNPRNRAYIAPMRECNYIFNRTSDGYEIRIPEYFEDLPDRILTDAVLNIFMMENDRRKLCTDNITEDLLELRDRLALIRSTKQLRYTQKGRNKDIGESIDRLLKMHLINESDIRNALFTWENRIEEDHLGICYKTLRIVAINPFLDYSIVSQEAFDKTVYHEILHLRQRNLGLEPEDPHDEQFMGWMREYPYYEESLMEMSRLEGDFDLACKSATAPADIMPRSKGIVSYC